MKKFFRVFYSQIFNSFFPLLIIAILLKVADSSKTASIFLLINFTNIYLLFSDYSSNTILLKNALQAGGISKDAVSDTVRQDIQSYIGLKAVILAFGFPVWILLCVVVPQLHQNVVSNILAYTFIIGNNINFYWLYMSSTKEYFFIISNFLGRLFFLLLLILFLVMKLDFFYLMPVVGVGSTVISLFTFSRFCKVFGIKVQMSKSMFNDALHVMRRDWPLVTNSFLMMTPTTCLSFFIGFVKNSSHVLVYAFAEKIFMAIRALMGVFVNAVYPIICQEGSIHTAKSKRILLYFYIAVFAGCVVTYIFSPYIFSYLKQPPVLNELFTKCLLYFLCTVVIISINGRYYLQLLVTNQLNNIQNFGILVISSVLTIGLFATNIYMNNSVIAVVQSVMIAELLIVLAFIGLTYKHRRFL